jgi:hypothetical protein
MDRSGRRSGLRAADERVWLGDAVLARPYDLPPIGLPLRLFAAIECAVVADRIRCTSTCKRMQLVERELADEK